MNPSIDVSVVLCTYNRADMLPRAIESILDQNRGDVSFELVIVNNNSTDNTADVIQKYVRSNENCRSIFVSEQGLSAARNKGIAAAHSEIIAFTDDDVQVSKDWVAKISQYFDRHPDVDFIGGKVLPEWESEPPDWLTSEHWAPLALVDYGDESFHVTYDRQVCLVGANLAVRRSSFERVGTFSQDVGRIGVGAGTCEDHEFELRVLVAGGQGFYAPDLVIAAQVQSERVEKSHHRRWYSGHGRSLAKIRALDLFNMREGSHELDMSVLRLFNSPAYLYRELFSNMTKFLGSTLRSDETRALLYEVRFREHFNYIREVRINTRETSPSIISELACFIPRFLGRTSPPSEAPKD